MADAAIYRELLWHWTALVMAAISISRAPICAFLAYRNTDGQRRHNSWETFNDCVLAFWILMYLCKP